MVEFEIVIVVVVELEVGVDVEMAAVIVVVAMIVGDRDWGARSVDCGWGSGRRGLGGNCSTAGRQTDRRQDRGFHRTDWCRYPDLEVADVHLARDWEP